jgi:hypothetical protein
MIYEFNEGTNLKDWQIVNDGVMGGLSTSELSLTKEGHGLFRGHVTTENNGGFASVMLSTFIELNNNEKTITIRIKGDGKKYQLRLKSTKQQYQSYIKTFKTNGEWQTLTFPLNEFEPGFRGRALDLPNFNFDKIEEVRFLIANKKEQDFELIIDQIYVK